MKRQRYVQYIVLAMSALMVIALAVGALSPMRPESDKVLPSGLPDHLMLGLASNADEITWMVDSGIPWDARYFYMTGGVNTGGSWSNWLSDGRYASEYMEASRRYGYLPVFTYYQMVKSLPMIGANEAEQDYTNLNNPQTMAAYFADFALLLDKAKAFGGRVIIHVEPDLWGYMQQRINGGEDPTSVSAAVSSSRYGDVRGYANNLSGFGKALIHLRDTHAPNVILAVHASPWATNLDVTTDHSPSLDVASVARHTARFLAATGNWDLVFVDLADRDAGYHEIMGKDNRAHWWDETNTTYPNFSRFAEYLSYLSRDMRRGLVIWQVPIGNTIMRTSNNTEGHYQDNRVQYFLGGDASHLQEYVQAGVVGILFGRGAPGPSTYNDAMKDGVTNPLPIDGNDQVSNVPDDDGGYLRAQAQAYYAAGAVSIPKQQPAGSPVWARVFHTIGFVLVLGMVGLTAVGYVRANRRPL